MGSLRGRKPLSETHPEICKEIKIGNPTEVSAGSDKKFEWECKDGHRWIASVTNRVLKGTGCPTCAKVNRNPSYGINLKKEFPEIAAEANGWDPEAITAGSKLKLEWKCPIGHTYLSRPYERTKKKHGCPICSGKKILSGFNDLLTLAPDIAAEMIGSDPTKVSAGNNKNFSWKCKKNHEYVASVHNRVKNKSGCPYCSGLKALPGFNDLATTHPHLALQAYGWDPKTVRAGTHKKLEWKCEVGHIFTATGEGRLSEKTSGCRVCNRTQVSPGANDLATTHPEIAKQAVGWDPSTISSGSNVKKLWRCEKGHEYFSSPISRTNTKKGPNRAAKGTNCPVCSGKKILPGYNDIATTHPEIAKQAVGWDPRTKTAGSNKKMDWQCEKTHVWNAAINNRISQNLGCPICSGQKVLFGFNDLTTTHPNLAKEAFGWDARLYNRGSSKNKKWKCAEGHIWTALISNRGLRGDGCPSCAVSGFDPNKDGWLYLLRHPSWKLLQIGITNVPQDRVGRHMQSGWEVIEIRGPMDGLLAREWEQSILKMLKKQGAELGDSNIAGKFSGYTEAWIEKTFPVTSIKLLMDQVFEDESKG